MNSKTAGLKPFTDFLWSREDYEDLVARGVFGPEDKIELLDGKLITMAAQNSAHRTALNLVRVYLDGIAALAQPAHVSVQSPVAIGGRSLPEPDLAVISGTIRDYADHHPSSAILIVEVADTSLEHDRGPKLRAYARAGIPEYWIVNLVDHVVEVYREPSGERYGQSFTVRPGSTLAPAGHDKHAVDAARLLP